MHASKVWQENALKNYGIFETFCIIQNSFGDFIDFLGITGLVKTKI